MSPKRNRGRKGPGFPETAAVQTALTTFPDLMHCVQTLI